MTNQLTLRITQRALIPLIGALVLTFTLVASTSASQLPTHSATPTIEAEAKPADTSAAITTIEKLLASGLVPKSARDTITRVVNEQVELHNPGATCRRIIANPNSPEELVERCLAAFEDNADARIVPPGRLCRRIAENPGDAPQNLIERCREWVASLGNTDGASMSPAEACRRIAKADAPGSDLVERCRTWLQSTNGQGVPIHEACRRILAGEHVDEALVERCEALIDGRSPQRPPARPDMTRPRAQDSDRIEITRPMPSHESQRAAPAQR